MRWSETTILRSPKRYLEEISKDVYPLMKYPEIYSTSGQNISVGHVTCVFVFGQMEIDSGEGLTEEFLYEEVHPKSNSVKQTFAKPRGPPGKRGNKRLIKGGGENGEES